MTAQRPTGALPRHTAMISFTHAPAEHLPIFLGGNKSRKRADPDNTSAGDIPASIAGAGLAHLLSRCGRALVRLPRTGGRAYAGDVALLLQRSARPGAGRNRAPRLFLPFPRCLDRPPAWRSELSTIDTTVLVAGALTAAAYFDRSTEDEREVRELADSLYRRVDWRWGKTVKRPFRTGGHQKEGSSVIAGRDITRR